jgi:hypothetical protein
MLLVTGGTILILDAVWPGSRKQYGFRAMRRTVGIAVEDSNDVEVARARASYLIQTRDSRGLEGIETINRILDFIPLRLGHPLRNPVPQMAPPAAHAPGPRAQPMSKPDNTDPDSCSQSGGRDGPYPVGGQLMI